MLLWKWVGCSKKCEGLSKDISANQYVPKPQPNTLQATHSRIALFPSVSLLFCFSYLSLSLHLHSSQFSPRVQAVAKKRIGEPVYVLDMLSFFSFFFFQLSVTSSELFQREMSQKINPFHPPQLLFTFSPDLFLLPRSVSRSVCWLQSKYTPRAQPAAARLS